jgi:hypothetical protein
MAILLGSSALVVAMMAILFRPGACEFAHPSPSAIAIAFWVTFGAFFFGLTYGLRQIVTEHATLRREHLVGGPLGPPLLRAYGDAGAQTTAVYWLYLAAFALVSFAGAWVTLARKCRRSTR